MIKPDYPSHPYRIKTEGDRSVVFDECRKVWVKLTPEEWVRQNFLQYIIHVKKYPSSLIAVEKEISLGELKKRFDIVVYDKDSKPWMIIECKEMNVALDKTVLDQVLRYNMVLQVPYLVITNGSHCHAFFSDKGQLTELNELPSA